MCSLSSIWLGPSVTELSDFVFACSYDHVRDNKCSTTPDTRTSSSSSEHSRSHGLPTSNCSAAPLPINLPVGAIPDVSSQMTSLNKHPSSHGSLAGTTETCLISVIFLMTQSPVRVVSCLVLFSTVLGATIGRTVDKCSPSISVVGYLK